MAHSNTVKLTASTRQQQNQYQRGGQREVVHGRLTSVYDEKSVAPSQCTHCNHSSVRSPAPLAPLEYSTEGEVHYALVSGIPLFVVFLFPMMVFPYEFTSWRFHGYDLGSLVSLTRTLSAFAVPLGLARLWAGARRPRARSPFGYLSCYFASLMLSLWVLSNDRGFYRLLYFVPQLILYHSVLNHYRMTPCVIPFARSL
ncbi:hypothetical protein V8E55_007661 [Tylopilus felleus]